MMMTPIWWWQRTRALRHFQTSPMHYRSTPNSGWVMLLRRVAALAMITKKWALPQKAPGYQCSGTSESWVSIFRMQISLLWVSVIWVAMCSAMACYCLNTSSWFVPLIICIFLLILIPIPQLVLLNESDSLI